MEIANGVLTICLLTRGRDAFLPECLASLEQFAKDPDVKFLVINNGAGEYSSKLLFEFVQRDVVNRNLIVREINDPLYSSLWNDLKAFNLGWILLPSDDDILLPNAIDLWRQQLSRNPKLVAIGASARVIEENARQTGVTLNPTNLNIDNPTQRFANCFFEPPFVWPSLYIYLPATPADSCNSRYAFDWWISLNLLASPEVSTTSEIILEYRIHSGQESSVASRRSKYFDAALWQTRFASSDAFRKWVSGSDPADVLLFWKTLLEKAPVYGSEEFGNLVVFNISEVLISNIQNREVVGIVIADLAANFKVFLKNDEGWHLSDRREYTNWYANIEIVIQKDVCKEVSDAALEFTCKDSRHKFFVSCCHSSSKGKNIRIDCRKLLLTNSKLNADIIIKEITEWGENNGSIQAALSPGERILIGYYRSLYGRLPSSLINVAKKFKQRV